MIKSFNSIFTYPPFRGLGGVFILLGVWFALYLNLKPLTNLLVFDLIGLKAGTHLGESVWFFVFEVPKVLLLLVLIVFGVGIIRHLSLHA